MTAPKLAAYFTEKQDDGRYYKSPFGAPNAVSVTSVLKGSNKDALVQWAADMTALFFAERPDFALTREKADAFQGARFAHNNVRDERGEVGNEVHRWVEADLDGGWGYPDVWDADVQECIDQYKLFLAAHEVKPLMTETTVWSEKNNNAGTLDFIAVIDGIVSLVDTKTSRNLWLEHEMQLAALENADYICREVPEDTKGSVEFVVTDKDTKKKVSTFWVKEEMPKIERRGFLHLRPTYTDPITGQKMPPFWDLVWVVDEDVPVLYEMFLGYNQVHAQKGVLSGLRKEREPSKINW